MRTRYLLVPLALFVFGCNQSSETTQSERPVSKKQKKMVAAPEFVEQQFNSLDYQVKAFSIGLERLENEKIKDYLRDKLPMLENLRSDFQDRKSTRLNSSHVRISYAVFCLKKKTVTRNT